MSRHTASPLIDSERPAQPETGAPGEIEYVETPYDRLTLELGEIKTLIEVINTVEDGVIEAVHVAAVARCILQRIDAAYGHAEAMLTGGAR